MGIRATVASMAVVLCLLVSCLTFPCAVRCSMAGRCHSASPMQMTAKADMGGVAIQPRPMLHQAPEATMPCEQQVCVETPAVNTDETHVAAQLSLLQQALVLTFIQWPASNSLPGWYRGSPIPRQTPISLHTVLRV